MPEDAVDQQQQDPAAGGQDGGQQDPAGREPAKPQLPREQEDAIAAKARKAAQAEARKAEAERDAALARIAELEAAEEERRKAEMTEVERAKAEAEEAKAAMAKAQADARASQLDAMRSRLIVDQAADLPAAYKAQVTGDDEETVSASIAKAKEAYTADRVALLQSIAAMTPEQLEAAFGEDGKALAARIPGPPRSVGAPTAAPNQPTAAQPADVAQMDAKQFREHLAKLGVRTRI